MSVQSCCVNCLYILGQPSDAITVALTHDNRAHEQLDRSDALQRDLALAGGLVQAKSVSQLLLRLGLWVIDLVAEDNEGNLGEFLHGKKGIEFGLDFGESDVVDGIDEEDNAVNLGEVISPDTTGYSKSAMMKLCVLRV